MGDSPLVSKAHHLSSTADMNTCTLHLSVGLCRLDLLFLLFVLSLDAKVQHLLNPVLRSEIQPRFCARLVGPPQFTFFRGRLVNLASQLV